MMFCKLKTIQHGKFLEAFAVVVSASLDVNNIKKKWGAENVFRAIALICDWLVRDENIQVNGLVVLIDNTNITWSHVMTMWKQDNGKKITQFYQVGINNMMSAL